MSTTTVNPNGGQAQTITYDYDSQGRLTTKAEGGALVYNSSSPFHAVKSASDGSWFEYDPNGNMTTRNIVGGKNYTLTYDPENRLTGVSGGASASYVYDGDGNRVLGTVNGVTTVYVGNYYEVRLPNSPVTYYYAGGQRVAQRPGGGPAQYLFSDHLGSTALVTNSSLNLLSELRYNPWGGVRAAIGTPAAGNAFTYTGQRQDSYINLYWYGSRWYDPVLGRWVQPDSIVPEAAQGVQAWDRYAYANNSPVVHNDPSGHCIDGVTTILCIAMGVGALVGGAASVYNLYQNNDQVSAGQVVEAAIGGALGGAVLGGGLVIAGAAVAIGASALVGVGAAACADGDCTNEGTALARSLGQAGETAAGIIKNTRRIPSATGTASYRIPDQWLETPKSISEVKNVAQLSLTNQIKDIAAYAQGQGYASELWVRESTKLSQPLQDLIGQGQAILKYLESK